MTYCGTDCCKECSRVSECGGCEKCGGHPFGGSCVAQRNEHFQELKQQLISEINNLSIPNLSVSDLYLLTGSFVNLAYPLQNSAAQPVQFLTDSDVYLGNQIEIPGTDRCYGVVACEKFILVGEYGCNGTDPDLVLYKRR